MPLGEHMNKQLICFAALVIFATATLVLARSGEEITTDLLKAANTSVATYKSDGMSSLISKSKDCYKNLSKYKFYCIYIDLAAYHIDELVRAGHPFPPMEYFSSEQFLSRSGEIFISANLTMEKTNGYLRDMTPIVNKMVDDALLKGKSASDAIINNKVIDKIVDEEIAFLGLSTDLLKSKVYLDFDGVNESLFTLEEYIASVLHNGKGFQSVKALNKIKGEGGPYSGVIFKFEGQQSWGFLIKFDSPDSFLSHLIVGDDPKPLDTPAKKSQAALIFLQMANKAE